jgi:hypothetical protein
MRKGLNKTSETTSLVGEGFLKHSKNFVPTISGVEVREGIGIINDIIDFEVLAIESVVIGGVSLLLIITGDGDLKAIIPEMKNKTFRVLRRYYDNPYSLSLSSTKEISKAEIIVASRYIYCITDDISVAIPRDGLCRVDLTYKFIIINAFDATIYDADDEELVLWRTGGFSSMLPSNTRLYYTIRNEFGGRGAPSRILNVPRDDSFLAAELKGMRKDVFAVHNDRELVVDTLYWGVRTSEYVEDSGTYTADFEVISDGVKNNLNDKVCVVASDTIGGGSNWRNGKIVANVGTGFGADNVNELSIEFSSQQLDVGIKDSAFYYTDDIVGDATEEYTCLLMRSPSGQSVLLMDEGDASDFTIGAMHYIPKVITSFDSANDPIEAKTGWAFKITSTPAQLEDQTSNPMTAYVQNTASTLDLQTATAIASHSTYACNIELAGAGTGSNDIFDGTDSVTNHIDPLGSTIQTTDSISWSTVVPAFAVDSSGDLVDVVGICRGFPIDPTGSGTDVDLEADVCFYDHDFWHKNMDGLSSTIPVNIDVDIDDQGFFFFNKEKELPGLSVYYYADGLGGRYFYDIYRVSDDIDFWIAGSYVNTENEYDVDDYTEGDTFFNPNNWTVDVVANPILISKINALAAASPKRYVESMKDFDSIAFYDNKFFSSLNGVVKVANFLMEVDPAKTITLSGNIRKLISSSYGVVAVKDNGVDIIDADLSVKPFIDFPVSHFCPVGHQGLFVADDGAVYMSAYKRYGSETVTGQTGHFNIVTQKISDIITDVYENWYIYDIIYYKERFYFSTPIGIFIYYANTNTWWRIDIPEESALKFVIHEEELYFYGGNFGNLAWYEIYSGGEG